MKKDFQVFSIRALHAIDEGELEKDFDQQLRMLVADCLERPGIDKARKLILEIELKPDQKSNGTCDDVFVECSTHSKCPNRPVRPYRMAANVKGGLRFQPDQPLGAEPDQED